MRRAGLPRSLRSSSLHHPRSALHALTSSGNYPRRTQDINGYRSPWTSGNLGPSLSRCGRCAVTAVFRAAVHCELPPHGRWGRATPWAGRANLRLGALVHRRSEHSEGSSLSIAYPAAAFLFSANTRIGATLLPPRPWTCRLAGGSERIHYRPKSLIRSSGVICSGSVRTSMRAGPG